MEPQIILVQEEPRGPSQLIEVPVVTNGASQVPFPDIQQLRSTTEEIIIIKSLRLITANVLVAPLILQAANAPLAELQKIALVLYADGWQKGQGIPILTLNDMTVPGGTFPFRHHMTRFANWRNVDWTKSFLQYANGTASANAPYTVLFDCEYVKLNPKGVEIKGVS